MWSIEELLVSHHNLLAQLKSKPDQTIRDQTIHPQLHPVMCNDDQDDVISNPLSVYLFPSFHEINLTDWVRFGGGRYTPPPIQSDVLRSALIDFKRLPTPDQTNNNLEPSQSLNSSLISPSPEFDQYTYVANLMTQLADVNENFHPRERLGGLGNSNPMLSAASWSHATLLPPPSQTSDGDNVPKVLPSVKLDSIKVTLLSANGQVNAKSAVRTSGKNLKSEGRASGSLKKAELSISDMKVAKDDPKLDQMGLLEVGEGEEVSSKVVRGRGRPRKFRTSSNEDLIDDVERKGRMEDETTEDVERHKGRNELEETIDDGIIMDDEIIMDDDHHIRSEEIIPLVNSTSSTTALTSTTVESIGEVQRYSENNRKEERTEERKEERTEEKIEERKEKRGEEKKEKRGENVAHCSNKFIVWGLEGQHSS